MKTAPSHILLAGAAPDTGNHGVTALARGAFECLRSEGETQLMFLDNGNGLRTGPSWHSDCQISLIGFKGGKRITAPDHMLRARLSLSLGMANPIADAFRSAKAVLDVSGGDSFSDIYGYNRFRQILTPKLMAIAAGKPLVLLPQTIGPFENPFLKDQAVAVMKRASLVYARDEKSFIELQKLLGRHFNPLRHRLGHDLAFALPKASCPYDVSPGSVGLNVSGLLWNDSEGARKQFGLQADYPWLMERLGQFLLCRGHTLYLIPHVAPTSGAESDLVACRALKRRLSSFGRVVIADRTNDPCSLKGLISQLEWCVGARMHATIAALSTGVPVANLAYSPKPFGVFRQLGVQSEVYDLRTAPAGSVFGRVIEAYAKRADIRSRIRFHLQKIQSGMNLQTETILDAVEPQVKEMAYSV